MCVCVCVCVSGCGCLCMSGCVSIRLFVYVTYKQTILAVDHNGCSYSITLLPSLKIKSMPNYSTEQPTYGCPGSWAKEKFSLFQTNIQLLLLAVVRVRVNTGFAYHGRLAVLSLSLSLLLSLSFSEGDHFFYLAYQEKVLS